MEDLIQTSRRPQAPGGESQQSPRWLRFVRDASAFISIASGLITLIQPLIPGLRTRVPQLPSFLSPYHLLIGILLICLGASLRWDRWQRRSLLRRPDLLIRRAAEQFVGRGEDVAFLLECVNSASLVWLVGESGVGKSHLVAFGLVPALRDDTTRMPLLISELGTDWLSGPSHALARALGEAEALYGGVPPLEPPPSEDVVERLVAMSARTGRLPVVIFDQFDDYQIRHQEHFARRQRIISARSLSKANVFWQALGKRVRQGHIVCVFVTRDDTVRWLESVRFVEPALWQLGRIRRGFVASFLDDATTADVIESPEAGWTQLRRRLCSDLETEGRVLPVEMRAAIESLVMLRRLTIEDYEAAGGLAGLKAAHFAHAVSEAAAYAGLEAREVRGLLLTMVDRAQSKTVPVTEQQMLASLSGAGRQQVSIAKAVRYLASRKLLRRSIDPSTKLAAWCLDHDVLCRHVCELERREERWQCYLRDALESYLQAATAWQKWRALLSPIAQVRLLASRVRGTVRYGSATSFALISALRLLVNGPVALACVVVLALSYRHEQAEADRLFSEIGLGRPDVMSGREARILWEMARSSRAVRLAVLGRAISDEASAVRFLARSEYVIHAAVGLDTIQRRHVVERILPRCYSTRLATYPNVLGACAQLVADLDWDANRVATFYVETAISRSDTLWPRLGWAKLSGLLPDQTRRLKGRLAAAIKEAKDPARIVALSWVLRLMPSEGGEERDAEIVAAILDAMREATPLQRLELGYVLAGVPGTWRTGQARAAFGEMIGLLARAEEWKAGTAMVTAESAGRAMLPEALAAVATKLSVEEATEVLSEALRTKWPRVVTPDSSIATIKTLAGKITTSSAASAYADVLAASEEAESDSRRREVLAEAASGVSKRVPAADGTRLVTVTTAMLETTTDAGELKLLANGLRGLMASSEGPMPRALCEQLRRAVVAKPGSATAIGEIIASLPVRECRTESAWLLERMLKDFEKAAVYQKRSLDCSIMASGIKLVAPRIDREGARRAESRLKGLFRRKKTAESARADVLECLIALPLPIDPEIAERVYAEVLQRVRPSEERRSFAFAYRLRGQRVSCPPKVVATLQEKQVVELVRSSLRALRSAETPEEDVHFARRMLEAVVPAVGQGMRGVFYQEALDTFREVSRRQRAGSSSNRLFALDETLIALGGGVRNELTDSIASEVVMDFREDPDPMCGALRCVLHSGNIRTLVEVIKWPTCRRGEGLALVRWASKMKGVSVAAAAAGPEAGEWWAFAAWADRQGFDTRSLPGPMPNFADSGY